jgi:tetratricopeptide (TPR) repeat protein/2-polyprenyl-3-methyl-5-hydroxy-6-metoxy-1,4-benzoquinol methylase
MTRIADALNLALQHHQAGRLHEAEILYRQILEAQPDNPHALHLLGLIAHHVGRHEEAVDLIGKAIAANPAVAEFHNDLGEACRAGGQPDKAKASYERAVALKPDCVGAFYNLGILQRQEGRLEEAAACYQQALSIKPDHVATHNNLGNVLKDMGKVEEAVAHYRQALAFDPASAEAYNNLGSALHGQGKVAEAIGCFKQAVSIKREYSEAHNNLGDALRGLGRWEEAVTAYRQALALNPSLPETYFNLGAALQAQEKLAEAVASYQRALALTPDYADAQANLAMVLHGRGQTADALKILFDGLIAQPANAQLRGTLAQALRGLALLTAGEPERAILMSLCRDDNIATQDLAPSIIGLVKNARAFPRVLRAARAGKDPFVSAASDARAFVREPLLLAALPRIVICDGELEQVLTHLRRWILLRAGTSAGLAVADQSIPFDFVCTLARQCFNVEYVFDIAKDEARQVHKLNAHLENVLQKPARGQPRRTTSRNLEPSLVLAALYGSLQGVKGWERLLEIELAQWSEPFQPLVREQVVNPQYERDIASRLTAITEIKDVVSRKVRRQYEESPYPRWSTFSRPPQSMSVAAFVRNVRPNETLREFQRPAAILVAGCGSGHHPVQTATAFRDCEVLAIDLSRASLAYASRMAERYNITNITFHQADILELDKLDRRFALIDCCGVLHHLKDPLKGWRVLVDLLEPDGLMAIGLYSSRGRRSIQVAREFVRAKKFPPTPDGIRRCRQAIFDLPEGHPARQVMAFPDFFSGSGCRDFIMHVQEHNFTAQDIAVCLDRLGLRFLGFQCALPIRERFRALFPEKSALTDLALWDRFEEANPGVFQSMYHFWCCRK